MMINFKIDYADGAHPKILEKLLTTNADQTPGYGEDDYCQQAQAAIQSYLGSTPCEIHFLVGGTQTNLTFISHALKPYEAVLSAQTGHIMTNEVGSIEATGHKIIPLPATDGKVTLHALHTFFKQPQTIHMVKPKLLYLSNPTELGTLYSKQELEELSKFCRQHHLYLYVDGARLGSGLVAPSNTLTLEDYARLTDAFYIGGTKNGALFGEALVLIHPELDQDFRLNMKQKGALLAKGRLLGLQFLTLFQDALFFEIAHLANQRANELRQGLLHLGISFWTSTQTNQLFPILPNHLLPVLSERFSFTIWEPYDEHHSVVRLVTSYATSKDDIIQFLETLNTLYKKDALN